MRAHILHLIVAPLTFSTVLYSLFFFNDPATTEIYTLSLHDALPILIASTTWTMLCSGLTAKITSLCECMPAKSENPVTAKDRKSTRLNSSHVEISYAVFCLKKKKKKKKQHIKYK